MILEASDVRATSQPSIRVVGDQINYARQSEEARWTVSPLTFITGVTISTNCPLMAKKVQEGGHVDTLDHLEPIEIPYPDQSRDQHIEPYQAILKSHHMPDLDPETIKRTTTRDEPISIQTQEDITIISVRTLLRVNNDHRHGKFAKIHLGLKINGNPPTTPQEAHRLVEAILCFNLNEYNSTIHPRNLEIPIPFLPKES